MFLKGAISMAVKELLTVLIYASLISGNFKVAGEMLEDYSDDT